MSTLRELLPNNPIFDVLASSKIRLDLSFRNLKQVYDLRCKFCHAVYQDGNAEAFSGSIKDKQLGKPFHLFSCANCGRRYDPGEPSGGVFQRTSVKRGTTMSSLGFPNTPYDSTEIELFDFDREDEEEVFVPELHGELFEDITLDDDTQTKMIRDSNTITAGIALYKNPILNILSTSKISLDKSFRHSDQRYDVQCKFCHAVYQDGNDNAFGPTIRYKSQLSSLLSCENCGLRYDPLKGPVVFMRKLDKRNKPFPKREIDHVEHELLDIPPPEWTGPKEERNHRSRTTKKIPVKLPEGKRVITLKSGQKYYDSKTKKQVVAILKSLILMSDIKELPRFIADVYNPEKTTIDAIASYQSQEEIVTKANDYRLIIESGEVPLTTPALTTAADFHIIIDLLDKDAETADLKYGYNKFSLTGEVASVDSFLFWLNDVLFKKFQPNPSLGKFSLDENALLSFTSGSSIASWNLVEVWFSPDLAEALKGFWSREYSMIHDSDKWFRMTAPTVVNTSTKQVSRSINSIVHFKSIRVTSPELPVLQTKVVNQASGGIFPLGIVATMIIDSEQYDLINQRNSILIPTSEFKRIQLTGTGVVRNFTMEAHVYYKNGDMRLLKLAPKEYMMFNLCFEKISTR